jgi:hypothetical protein
MGLKTNSDTLPGDKSFFPLSGGGLIPTSGSFHISTDPRRPLLVLP